MEQQKLVLHHSLKSLCLNVRFLTADVGIGMAERLDQLRSAGLDTCMKQRVAPEISAGDWLRGVLLQKVALQTESMEPEH